MEYSLIIRDTITGHVTAPTSDLPPRTQAARKLVELRHKGYHVALTSIRQMYCATRPGERYILYLKREAQS